MTLKEEDYEKSIWGNGTENEILGFREEDAENDYYEECEDNTEE